MSTIDERVQAASAALIRGEDANWELARLTWESTFELGNVGTQKATTDLVSMEEWCLRIREVSGRKFSSMTGRRYRAVWETARSYTNELTATWAELYGEACGGFDRFANQDAKNAIKNFEHVKPEVKRELLNKLVQDGGPELAVDAYRAAMAQPEVAKRIENEFVQRAAQDSMLASRVNSAWTEFHPTPTPTYEPVSGREYMVHARFGASARARYEQVRKTDLALLLRFIDERRPLSEEIVKDFDAIITDLERLRAEIELDEDAIRKALRPDADISIERLLNSVGL